MDAVGANEQISIGATAGGLAVVGHIGSGAYARVYECVSKQIESTYAVKVYESAHEMTAWREIQALEKLKRSTSPDHCVKLNGYWRDTDWRMMLALSFHGRQNIWQLGVNAERLSMLASHMVHALRAVHSVDLVYHDLKPDNVVWDAALSRFILCDFGLAQNIDANARQSGCQSFCGTLLYAAPEVVFRARHGQPIDAWALGVLLYEQYEREPPFDAGSQRDFIDAMRRGRRRPFARARPEGLHPSFFHFVDSLMRNNAAMRLGYEGIEKALDHEFIVETAR